MKVEFDPQKNRKNLAKHGISLEEAANFDYASARTEIDLRKDYGEIRYVATGYLYERLHVLCYIEKRSSIRAISLRKANMRESKKYEKEKLH